MDQAEKTNKKFYTDHPTYKALAKKAKQAWNDAKEKSDESTAKFKATQAFVNTTKSAIPPQEKGSGLATGLTVVGLVGLLAAGGFYWRKKQALKAT